MLNYFKLLNLPQAPDVDLNLLESNYLKTIAKLHPDSCYYNSKDNQALKFTAEDINNAYKSLKDNHKRFLHLLNILGFTQEAKVEDLDFLMKFINYREVLENSASDIDNLQKMKKKLCEERELLINQIKQNFLAQEYDNAQENVAKFAFYRRIIDQVIEQEESLYEAI